MNATFCPSISVTRPPSGSMKRSGQSTFHIASRPSAIAYSLNSPLSSTIFFSFLFFFSVARSSRKRGDKVPIGKQRPLSLSLLSVAIIVMSSTDRMDTYGNFNIDNVCTWNTKNTKYVVLFILQKIFYNLVNGAVLANVNCSRAVSFAAELIQMKNCRYTLSCCGSNKNHVTISNFIVKCEAVFCFHFSFFFFFFFFSQRYFNTTWQMEKRSFPLKKKL